MDIRDLKLLLKYLSEDRRVLTYVDGEYKDLNFLKAGDHYMNDVYICIKGIGE